MNKGLYTLNGVHNSPTQTSITVNEAIQTETPASSSGTDSAIRVEMDTGIYRYQEYTSWTGSVFTIASTDCDDEGIYCGPRNDEGYPHPRAGRWRHGRHADQDGKPARAVYRKPADRHDQ
jgi:hypothetical protein